MSRPIYTMRTESGALSRRSGAAAAARVTPLVAFALSRSRSPFALAMGTPRRRSFIHQETRTRLRSTPRRWCSACQRSASRCDPTDPPATPLPRRPPTSWARLLPVTACLALAGSACDAERMRADNARARSSGFGRIRSATFLIVLVAACSLSSLLRLREPWCC